MSELAFLGALSWRITEAPGNPGWFMMIFEGSSEAPGVRGLTKDEKSDYLDSVVSVSESDRDRDQLSIDGCEGPSSLEGFLPF